jgi:peptidyl-prolyl cis-trans isomerase A (cyclophilin A)
MARLAYPTLAAACVLLTACSSAPPPETKAPPKLNEPAPETFKVKLLTTKGDVVIEVTRALAPKGVDHFHTLLKTGFYDGARFFRVRPDFVVQFGIAGDPKTNRLWSDMKLQDDPVKASNTRGMATYATAGPDTRTTQIFINLGDNKRLDGQGFAPFGKVVAGMDLVDAFYSGYGEMSPRGAGPDPQQIEEKGNAYLEARFPRLDYIKQAIVE